jgi:hypothetical protein
MTDPIVCDYCGEEIEEGYFTPGSQSPDAGLKFCCVHHRAGAFSQRHPDATPEEVFCENASDEFHRIYPEPTPSRNWHADG